MPDNLIFVLASILMLGVGAQWLAWWLRLPAILPLLVIGFLAGPVVGLLKPDEQLGDLLLPAVSLGVAMILFEGGLSLRLRELRESGTVVWRLVTIGAVVSWLVIAASGRLVLGQSLELAVLVGAILVVTGPTVIGPLLQHIRPAGPTGKILKWEGIVIDPVGAMLAVLVFEVISLKPGLVGTDGVLVDVATQHVAWGLIKTIVAGGGLGLAAGLLLAAMLRYFLIPDFLENAVTVMLVLGVYTAAHEIQHESGLLATTVMGVTLANQRLADVRQIVEFKESLRVLLISTLFIVLAARLDLQAMALVTLNWRSLVFLMVIILIARPLSVYVSTMRSSLTWRERLFLAWMAPRGIVAAAVASVFALRMQESGYDASALVPTTFLAIVGTVVIYGITAPLAARWLGVADSNPQGVLVIGGHSWARALAEVIHAQGFRVVLVDTNRTNLAAARMAGLETHAGSILAEHVFDEVDLGGLGKCIAATPNDWVNLLAVQQCMHIFDRSEVFQVPLRTQQQRQRGEYRHLHGRWLFGEDVSHDMLFKRFARAATFKATGMTDEFTYESFCEQHGDEAIPMFVVKSGGKELQIVNAEQLPDPVAGDTVISLVGGTS